MNEWQQAVANLTSADWQELALLNEKIQSNTEPWGEVVEPVKTADNQYTMGYVSKSSLLNDFTQTWYEKDLVIAFDWSGWQEGRGWFKNEDGSKYKKLDDETALKLITAIIRNDRFNEGALVSSFENGDLPKIINTFIANHS